ncbi:VOC family protein [Paraburkholderia sp. SARCC-3016]|uniref:VOC family protein n=1 Tax=Paraburkholderia sp. SARCC-3016 TaxID=3058611 RepID=UPI00280863EE|nr:VOC family protein [Paraburkholderia sp. SARCC-3016]MDQ7977057.1 VOC family protein [Paraburkholderia sp. SARCC-3016]
MSGHAKNATPPAEPRAPRIESINAVTLGTSDMARAVQFYAALGFPFAYGGPDADFTSYAFGGAHLNLIAETHGPINWWGRVIIHVSDVDALYQRALDAGLVPESAPADASWGERYFHIRDPDGHQLSFAKRLR